MPNYFALMRKGDPADKYIPLAIVDEEICKALGKTVDEQKYYLDWYDSIGLRLALGKTFEDMEKEYSEYQAEESAPVQYWTDMLAIIAFMKEHYVSSSWARIGKG